MRSMQSSGMNPISARKPVCGTRNGMDMRIANNPISPHINIFSFFIFLFYVVILQRYEEIYLSLSVYIIFET